MLRVAQFRKQEWRRQLGERVPKAHEKPPSHEHYSAVSGNSFRVINPEDSLDRFLAAPAIMITQLPAMTIFRPQ